MNVFILEGNAIRHQSVSHSLAPTEKSILIMISSFDIQSKHWEVISGMVIIWVSIHRSLRSCIDVTKVVVCSWSDCSALLHTIMVRSTITIHYQQGPYYSLASIKMVSQDWVVEKYRCFPYRMLKATWSLVNFRLLDGIKPFSLWRNSIAWLVWAAMVMQFTCDGNSVARYTYEMWNPPEYDAKPYDMPMRGHHWNCSVIDKSKK